MAYEVIWRDAVGKQRCETFPTRREADARDREVRDLRERERHDRIDAGTEPLREATERWWVDHVEVTVSRGTAKIYATCLDRHLMPRLGVRGHVRDPALLSLMTYAGLRPGEAFALSWDCVGERSLIVEHGRADGELKETKTGKIRTVGLLAPVSEDLAAWRMSSSGSAGLVFPRPDREVFRDTDYRNWRKRHFDPVAAAVQASHGTPYTLRHSFASLLVQAGWNPLEIAVEMGNSPEVVQRDYSHLFREFARGERVDPEATIVAARRAAAG